MLVVVPGDPVVFVVWGDIIDVVAVGGNEVDVAVVVLVVGKGVVVVGECVVMLVVVGGNDVDVVGRECVVVMVVVG